MSELADFITARLEDDEAAAMALGPVEGRWVIVTSEHGDEALLASETRGHAYLSLPLPMLDFLRHIIRHDPARVLREVTAKRARLAYYLDAQAKLDHIIAHPGEMSPGDQGMWLGKTAAARMACRHDATAWSDHPDYRAEWAPAL